MFRFGPIVSVSALLRSLCSLAALLLFPAMAQAQTVYQYTNNTAGAIADSTTCAAVVTRTFTVLSAYSVADVDLGVALTHNNRNHLRVSLTSPSGTTVSMMTNVGGGANHLSVLFDDEAAAAISTHTANDGTGAVPPYQRTFRPASVLSAFDGQAAAGTWTMTICDSVTGTTGNFTRADLYISPREADLSLTKIVSNATPARGANVNYTLSVTNAAASALTSTGIQVRDQLPLGVTFVSATGTGSYNNGTGIWSVGTLAPGASASITITVTITASAGAPVLNSGEISASSAFDGDSTPDNGSTTEDDDASVSFTVSGARVAGTPPTLICPVGSTLFDWDTRAWPDGDLNESFTVTGIGTVNYTISMSGGTFLNLAAYGGQSPGLQNTMTGGLAGAQLSLIEITDFTSQTGSATTVINLPTAVPGVQFRVFDIDYNAGQYADRITVTGSFNGSPVTPTLTNGVVNYVIGNSAYGDGTSADASGNGNIVVTFSSPVDTITVTYGNHSLAPANPGQQAIAVHDITMCNPQTNLSVTKVSTVVSDGISGSNPKALPQAIVRYCILVSNSGSATATNIAIADAIPATVTYVPGTLLSGTTCAGATTAEDDNAAGADENDPFGVSVTGTTLTGTAASLGPTAAFAIAFNATVN